MYNDMILILKRYIKAERSGNWNDHLLEIQNMLPYTVSSGHHHYMQCLPLYLDDMRSLKEKHPALHKEFEAGNFTVRKVPGKFNGVWTDLALEQTYNEEGKSVLFKGITQKEATKSKYVNSVPLLTEVSESVKAMASRMLESPW